MYRGTTPTLIFNVNLASEILADLAEAYITIQGNNVDTLEFAMENIAIDSVNKTMSIKLTQEQTLAYSPKAMLNMQIRCKDSVGNAYACNIVSCSIEKILKDGVI